MKVLVLGGSGMLGHKLVQQLFADLETWTTIRGSYADVGQYGIFDRERTIGNIDALDLASVTAAVERAEPNVVINAIGTLKQEAGEQGEAHTFAINSTLPQALAKLSDRLGFRLILVSTDCVFDGARGNYSEEDEPNANDIYGISKLRGEAAGENVLTLRTSIIGRELSTSHSLVEWFISNRGGSVEGFANAIYTGFPTIVFADIIKMLIVDHPDMNGLFHVSSEPISKFDLLEMINEKMKLGIEIRRNEDFRIDRSLDSTKFRQATGFRSPDWNEMIDRMVSDPTDYISSRSPLP